MTRPAVFTQGDIAKLLKGARAAGMPVTRVTIDRAGKIVADFGVSDQSVDAPNEWDTVLHAEEKRTAQRRK